MYGQIYDMKDLPEDCDWSPNMKEQAIAFYTVRYSNEEYCIPITRGMKTNLKDLGIDKLEDLTKWIMDAIRIKMQNQVAGDVHLMLSQKIDEGFHKLYSKKLFDEIINRMDNKQKLIENKNNEG